VAEIDATDPYASLDARRVVRKVDRFGWTFLCRACRHGHRCTDHGEAVSRAQTHICHDHDATGSCVIPPSSSTSGNPYRKDREAYRG
jgi:hypothetical protein